MVIFTPTAPEEAAFHFFSNRTALLLSEAQKTFENSDSGRILPFDFSECLF